MSKMDQQSHITKSLKSEENLGGENIILDLDCIV